MTVKSSSIAKYQNASVRETNCWVIVMEYLTRCLKLTALDNKFRFHPYCKNVGLVSLCFADDLLMFCKAKVEVVEIMMGGFKEFCDVSGMEINMDKSQLFVGGVSTSVRNAIRKCTGFSLSKLPMRYLGLPLSSKKWSWLDCQGLLDKFRGHLKVWGSRNLSLAARCQLINSVLFATQAYWASMFAIPRRVMEELEKLSRKFLWGGNEDKVKIPLVAWDKVCSPKEFGGLGVKNFQLWNEASLVKYLWALSTKQDTLWVRWIHSVYLKWRDIWDYQPPSSVCWYLKVILKLRDSFPKVFIDDMGLKFKVNKCYYKLLSDDTKDKMKVVIWNRLSAPRHAIYMWLVHHGKLLTRDRMLGMGMNLESPSCLFCDEVESVEHLFFDCKFSKKVCDAVGSWICQGWPAAYGQWQGWAVQRRGSRVKKRVIRAAMAGCVYEIWRERCSLIFTGTHRNVELIVQNVKFYLRNRLLMMDKGKLSSRDRDYIVKLVS